MCSRAPHIRAPSRCCCRSSSCRHSRSSADPRGPPHTSARGPRKAWTRLEKRTKRPRLQRWLQRHRGTSRQSQHSRLVGLHTGGEAPPCRGAQTPRDCCRHAGRRGGENAASARGLESEEARNTQTCRAREAERRVTREKRKKKKRRRPKILSLHYRFEDLRKLARGRKSCLEYRSSLS